jgi:hypothetical protein
MRDFLDPAGLRLLDWSKFRKRAIQLRADTWPRTRPSARQATQANRVLPDNPPKWFLSLDAELLMENERLKSRRYVKPLYQDMPTPADEEQRWAASATPGGELRLHKPTGANTLHGQHGNVEVLTYTFTTSPNNPADPMTHTHTTENLNLETTVLVHIATPLTTPGPSEEENPICLHPIEHEHIRQHVDNVATRVLAAVHGSHQTHPSHEYEDPILTPQPTTAHACATDGSKFTIRDLHGIDTLCPASPLRGGLSGLAGVPPGIRPARCPRGGVPPAVERQLQLLTYLIPRYVAQLQQHGPLVRHKLPQTMQHTNTYGRPPELKPKVHTRHTTPLSSRPHTRKRRPCF